MVPLRPGLRMLMQRRARREGIRPLRGVLERMEMMMSYTY
jgi:hypothetical protein